MFFNTTKRPSPPGSTKGPLSRSPGLRLAGRAGRCCSCRSATGTKRLATEVADACLAKRNNPKQYRLGMDIFQGMAENHPQMKGIPTKNLLIFGVRGLGTSSGRSVFFFRNAKKAWEKHEKLLGLMIHKRQIHSGKLRNGGIFYGDRLVTGRYSFLG